MIKRLGHLLEHAGHLALWAGVYVGAAVVCLAQLAGVAGPPGAEGGFSRVLGVRAEGVALAFCLALTVYLLDRVKLRDAWLDPADLSAHPRRYRYLRTRTRMARWVALAAVVAACVLAWILGGGRATWVLAMPPVAVFGGVAYAAGPRRGKARPKDRLLFKNAYVACGITGCAALIAVAGAGGTRTAVEAWRYVAAHAAALAVSGAILWVRVFADAVLCDLDDLAADREFGTRTLPNWLGHRRAWNMALGVRLGVAAVLAVLGVWGAIVPRDAAFAWAAVTAGSSVVVRALAPSRVREWVDVRSGMEAVVASVMMAVMR